MISASQCHAARALLNWSQPDLAARADIHIQTISNFEKESSTPNKTTLEKIARTFEAAGIVFLEDDGIKRTRNVVNLLESEDANI